MTKRKQEDLDALFDEFEKDIADTETSVEQAAAVQPPPEKKPRLAVAVSAAPSINKPAPAPIIGLDEPDAISLLAANPHLNPDFALHRQSQLVQQQRNRFENDVQQPYVVSSGDQQQATPSAFDKQYRKKTQRTAAGHSWDDQSMADWPDNDYRIFVGNLGNDVTDEVLGKAFAHFKSFNKAKVIRDKKTTKTKGYGFISLLNGEDYIQAMTQMNGKYIGSRPCKLTKSAWKDRTADGAAAKQKRKQQFV